MQNDRDRDPLIGGGPVTPPEPKPDGPKRPPDEPTTQDGTGVGSGGSKPPPETPPGGGSGDD
jgi:hypothetical protein